MEREIFYNRDLSWLSFNYRVLQEARNPDVPIVERLRFLAIYSSNLDEFYRVRVASHRHLMKLQKKTRQDFALPPEALVKRINRTVNKQQNELGEIFREQLIPEFAKYNIFLVNNEHLPAAQVTFAREYYKKEVAQYVNPVYIQDNINEQADMEPPFLENKWLYFAARLESKENEKIKTENVIINIPSNDVSRFLVLPSEEGHHPVIQLDDVLRLSMDIIFPEKKVTHLFAIKLSRDAELYLEDEFTEDVIDKIKASLKKRDTGAPSRFLYDSAMPKSFANYLQGVFSLEKEDMIPGGRSHNFNDFFSFPAPTIPQLFFEPFLSLPHAELQKYKSIFDAVSARDYMLHFPYQSYDEVIRFVEEASQDPAVEAIKITLYRVARDSRINLALVKAAQRGVPVTIFDEVQARFDEESNIYWGDELEKAGAKVIYSYEHLKVHSKLLLVTRRESGELKRYAFLASGNFNEKTAKIYCDHGLFTADPRLTEESDQVFDYLENREVEPEFEHLMVAPFLLRKQLKAHIKNEINNAEAGKKAQITLKVNSLEDKKMIKQLYKASNAGVKIRIIVRGICCLLPGQLGLSENIKIISIVDRFLEHARVYMFYNGGKEKIYVASADWMKRNLSRRVEVAFPIYNESIRDELKLIIKYQLKDNVRARKINKTQNNSYKKSKTKDRIRAQYDTYYYLKAKHIPGVE